MFLAKEKSRFGSEDARQRPLTGSVIPCDPYKVEGTARLFEGLLET